MKKIAFVADVHLSDTPPKVRKDPDYLSTLLNKLRFIIENSDSVVFLGDLFKTPNISSSALCKVISFFNEYKDTKDLYSIIGNHDVPYLSSYLLYKTSLGILDVAGVIEVVSAGIMLHGISIKPIPFQKEITCPDGMDILVGHCFFESELDPDFSLTSDMLKGKGCKLVILGHDHSPYSNVKLDGCEIVRTGSICRDSSHTYNLDELGNRVCYYEVVVDETKSCIVSHGKKKIPVLSPREVFSEEVFNQIGKKSNKFAYLYDVSALLEKYKDAGDKRSSDGNKNTVLTVMREMKIPEDVICYVRERYTSLGMTLR